MDYFLDTLIAANKVCCRPQPSPSALSLLPSARRLPSYAALYVLADDSEGAAAPASRFGLTRRVPAATAAAASTTSGRAASHHRRRCVVRALHACACTGVRCEAPERAGVRVHVLVRAVCVRCAGGIDAAPKDVVPRQ